MKHSKSKLKSIFGFPYLEPCKEKPTEASQQKGISLLIALMTIALMMTLVGDMIVSSSVNLELAAANKDKVKAEYLAKSGFNLSIFLLTLSWAWDLYQAQPSAPPPIKKDLSDSDESMWNVVNSLPPIGASSVALLKTAAKDEEDPFKLKGIFNEQVASTMAMFEDQFSINISDESSKININDCSKGHCIKVVESLIALFSCPAEKAFLESKNLRPEELAYRIKDFISESSATSQESGFSDKNDPYRNIKPPYETKSLPFDSINELKLVAGWDDALHAVFSPYLTVYPFNDVLKQSSKININTASRGMIGCLVRESMSASCAEKFNIGLSKIKSKGTAVASDAKDIKKTMQDLMCYSPSGESSQDAKNNKEDWFDVKSSVFRVEIRAETGMQIRTLEAVIRRIMPKDQSNLRSKQDIKKSYEILYWKMI